MDVRRRAVEKNDEYKRGIQLLRSHLRRRRIKMQTYANKGREGVTSMRTFAYKCFYLAPSP